MTDTNTAVEQILKTDARGRVRTSARRRESLLEEFDASGLSAVKFAALTGIKYQTFATWLQKRQRRGAPPAKSANTARWLEAVLEQTKHSGGNRAVVLELPGGARMEVADEKQAVLAAALVRALAQAC